MAMKFRAAAQPVTRELVTRNSRVHESRVMYFETSTRENDVIEILLNTRREKEINFSNFASFLNSLCANRPKNGRKRTFFNFR